MPTRRQRRVNALIREALSELVQREVADPRLDFVTITDVDTTSDLRQAHVYVAFLGNPEEQREGLKALTKATGYLRRQLGQRVYLRYVPELAFHLDDSTEKGLHIDKILDDLENAGKLEDE
ncbi:MAG: 30S ribosome-binding factor RbfA [Anaerolineae bacterium]|nr:30S ribosome-binding factor RbfA [Anaerolineae bacterium]